MLTEKIRDMVLAAAIASTATMGITTACSNMGLGSAGERFEERAVPLQDGRTIACLFWYSPTGSQEGGMHCHNYTPSEGVLPK